MAYRTGLKALTAKYGSRPMVNAELRAHYSIILVWRQHVGKIEEGIIEARFTDQIECLVGEQFDTACLCDYNPLTILSAE